MAISVGGWGSTSITTNGWGARRRVELILSLSADYIGKRTDPSTQREKPVVVLLRAKPDEIPTRRKPDEIPARSAGAGGDEAE